MKLAFDLDCPACLLRYRWKVTLTRQAADGQIVRRHTCQCGHRFYSVQPQAEILPNHRLRWKNNVPHVSP